MIEKGLKLFWLGLFIIAAIATVTWLLLFLRPSYGDGAKEVRIRFTNVEKVSVGTRVTYAGKPVGTVVAIHEVFNARDLPTDKAGDYYFYELVLKVDSSVRIYSSDEIVFTTTGLLGEKSVAIIPRAPPAGTRPTEVTDDILYAGSSDTFEQALGQIADVKDAFADTLGNIDKLITENRKEFRQMLLSVTKAADEMAIFLERVNESEVVTKLGESAGQLAGLGESLRGDELYGQILAVICEMRRLIYDINNYGLLFQYNRKWQRKQMQECCCE